MSGFGVSLSIIEQKLLSIQMFNDHIKRNSSQKRQRKHFLLRLKPQKTITQYSPKIYSN